MSRMAIHQVNRANRRSEVMPQTPGDLPHRLINYAPRLRIDEIIKYVIRLISLGWGLWLAVLFAISVNTAFCLEARILDARIVMPTVIPASAARPQPNL